MKVAFRTLVMPALLAVALLTGCPDDDTGGGGGTVDTGSADAGGDAIDETDLRSDTGQGDTGTSDVSTDTGGTDTGTVDTGGEDTSTDDTGTTDTSGEDVGIDAPLNAAPEGSIDGPADNVTIVQGEAVEFTGSCNDSDGHTPLTHSWDFDGAAEGLTELAPGPIEFAASGVYEVTFTCTDAMGLADESPETVTITVTDQNVVATPVFQTAFDLAAVTYDATADQLYILSAATHQVVVVDSDGELVDRFAYNDTFEMDEASGLAVDGDDGLLYVLRSRNSQGTYILVLELDGSYSDLIRVPTLAGPLLGLTIDPQSDSLYAYAAGPGNVVSIDPDTGEITTLFSTQPLGGEGNINVVSMVVLPDGGFALMDEGGTVTITDSEGGYETSFSLDDSPVGLGVDSGDDGDWGTTDDALVVAIANTDSTPPAFLNSYSMIRLVAGDNSTFEGDDTVVLTEFTDALGLPFQAAPGRLALAFDSQEQEFYVYMPERGMFNVLTTAGALIPERRFLNVALPTGLEAPSDLDFDDEDDMLWLWSQESGKVGRIAPDGANADRDYNPSMRFDGLDWENLRGVTYHGGAIYQLDPSAVGGSTITELNAGVSGSFDTDDDALYFIKHNFLANASAIDYDSGRGALAVTTDYGGQLHWFDLEMNHLGFVSLGEQAGIMRPTSIAYDATNDRYLVFDAATSQVLSVEVAGRVPMQGAETTDLGAPTSLLVRGLDVTGDRLRIADANGEAVWSFDHDGNFVGDFTTIHTFNVDSQDDVTVHPDTGDLYILDSEGLLVTNPDGVLLDFIRISAINGGERETTWFGLDFDETSEALYLRSSDEVYELDLANGTLTELFETSPLPGSMFYCDEIFTPDVGVFAYGLVRLTGGGFMLLCIEGVEGAVVNVVEVDGDGDFVRAFDPGTAGGGGGPEQIQRLLLSMDKDTGLLYLLTQQSELADTPAAQGIGLIDVAIFDAGDDGTFGTDDDPDPSSLDLTDAFPHVAGTAEGGDFYEHLTRIPEADGDLFVTLYGFQGDDPTLHHFDGELTWLRNVETCPLPEGTCVQPTGLYYDPSDEALFILDTNQEGIFEVGRSGTTLELVVYYDGQNLASGFGALTFADGSFYALRRDRDSDNEGDAQGVRVIEFSPGENGEFDDEDDRIYEVGYSFLNNGRDLMYDDDLEGFFVVTEGDGRIQFIGRDLLPGSSIPLATFTTITEPMAIEADPETGMVYIVDDELERIFTITMD